MAFVDVEWMSDAACARPEFAGFADAWHPQKGNRAGMAHNVCENLCPVRAQCEAYADRMTADVGPQVGLWGGEGTKARDQM